MNPRKKLEQLIKKYQLYFERIVLEHKKINNHIGHSLDHTLMVAQYGVLIADDQHIGELAWLAGLMHNTDRISRFPEREIGYYLEILSSMGISNYENGRIKNAVMHHSELNKPDDDELLIIVKDADRLANIGPLNIIRNGQHHRDIPAITLGVCGLHPESTFKKAKSALDFIFYNLEWEEMLRLPKARAIGKKQFDYYRDFLRRNREQFAEVGLDEWPLSDI
jgi:hypothetical protein